MKHLAYRTEQAYVEWVKRFILFHNKRHPSEMGASEVRAFLTHLARNREVAASTQNHALNAIVFMYREVLERDPGEFGEFQKAKRPKRLPTILTRDEVQRVLAGPQRRLDDDDLHPRDGQAWPGSPQPARWLAKRGQR